MQILDDVVVYSKCKSTSLGLVKILTQIQIEVFIVNYELPGFDN